MLLLRAFGARPTGVSFRLPSELRAGDQLEGDARLPQLGASEGLRWERVATVADLEEVELPNGRAHARRLDYTDTSRLASQASSREGTEWLAPGVGLVRLRETVAGRLAYELELSRITRPQGS